MKKKKRIGSKADRRRCRNCREFIENHGGPDRSLCVFSPTKFEHITEADILAREEAQRKLEAARALARAQKYQPLLDTYLKAVETVWFEPFDLNDVAKK